MGVVKRLLIFFIIICVMSQGWAQSIFSCDGIDDRVKCVDGSTIQMDEENEDNVEIRIIKIITNETPLVSVIYGSSLLLGYSLTNNTGEWFITINRRQDYEDESMRRYTFLVNGEHTLTLHIINIDDNPPSVSISPCDIEEDHTPGEDTDCIFQVIDPDGYISTNVMECHIIGNAGEVFNITELEKEEYIITYMLVNKIELDYAVNQLYIFDVVAIDSAKNESKGGALVKIINKPIRPPIWVKQLTTERFNEKEDKTFNVEAKDGNTGINGPIIYDLGTDYEFITIDKETGIINVKGIDRDKEKQEMFPFNITAINENHPHLNSIVFSVFIVDDINDNKPTFNKSKYFYEIVEERADASFDEKIICEDLDLGVNAEYTVTIIKSEPPEAIQAFIIIPNSGYQLQNFTLAILQPNLLDYDNATWQNIELIIEAKERSTNELHSTTATVNINLLNWNDEEPIFAENPFKAEFNETEGPGYEVIRICADDRDIDDELQYEIIDKELFDMTDGVITIKNNVSFDYDIQNVIFVRLQVQDTLCNKKSLLFFSHIYRNTEMMDKLSECDSHYPFENIHTRFGQLEITILDVNNKPPTFDMPRNIVKVEENSPGGFKIEDCVIIGKDLDTTAVLSLEINWKNSYALKQGRSVDDEFYTDCVKVEYDSSDPRNIIAHLIVTDTVVIDYEKFDVLVLSLILTDHKQVIGDGVTEGTLSITIVDVNDNAPEWTTETLNFTRSVREASDKDIIIGSIQAIDIDGPEFNVIRYGLEPIESGYDDWVAINADLGELTVYKSGAIDADTPKRDSISYLITATDCKIGETPAPDVCYITNHTIHIMIRDTNNKVPFAKVDEFKSEIAILENTGSGERVVIIVADDYDRDEPFHNITYSINYNEEREIRDLFSVNTFTGEVIVDLKNNAELDRDVEPSTYTFAITLTDNYLKVDEGISRTNQTTITVILLDENDNAPEMPDPKNLRWSLLENIGKDYELFPNITAKDIDEPNTPNSHVHYNILRINKIYPDIIEDVDILRMESPDNVSGILYTTKELKSFYGTYDTFIEACDFGEIPMCSNETYELEIRPFNYKEPKFVNIENDDIIRLHLERAMGGSLYKPSGEPLDDFVAEDPDGLHAGEVTFSIIGDPKTIEYFKVTDKNKNKCELSLKKNLDLDTRDFTVQLLATDKGTEPGSLNSNVTFNLKFVSMSGLITFDNQNTIYDFIEGENFKNQNVTIEEARDPKNDGCDSDCYDIYYYIVDGDTDIFELIDKSQELRLKKALNRDEATSHSLRIAATNDANAPGTVDETSILKCTINVKEVDPKPKFDKSVYNAGMRQMDMNGLALLNVNASHSENLEMTYEISSDITVSDSSLNTVKDHAFELDPKTGVLVLNFQPNEAMKGMFEFKVQAVDTEKKTDETTVKIHVISSDNQVEFIFFNEPDVVNERKDNISDVLTSILRHNCHVYNIKEAISEDNKPMKDKTSFISYFTDNDDSPIPKKDIEEDLEDNTVKLALMNEMSKIGLNITKVVQDEDSNDSLEAQLRIILIVVSTVLGVLVVVLLVAYSIRTRDLNKRLKALSTTKFGSQDSGLNRIGVAMAVPGTNKHAIEGSNPFYNEEITKPNFDVISTGSGDSDLIGVEDDPQFSYDNDDAENDSNT